MAYLRIGRTLEGAVSQAELDAFVGTSNIATVGTVGTGTWEGTDVGVAHGGTGASTLTANYALLGNGTSAPQMIAPSTDGNVLTSTGSTWQSEAAAGGGGLSSMQIIQAGTTTYSRPTGINTIQVFCTGSGGGGGAVPDTPAGDSGGGGGAGGTSIRIYDVSATSSITCAVATGGTGGLEGSNNGVAGATSTFEGPSSTITGTGGGYGRYGNNHASPGAGGIGVNGQLNLRGSAGGGGQDAALGSVVAGMGGSSYWGGGGAGASHSTDGTVGETGGGGGGAIHSNHPNNYADGQNGGNGIIVVYEYK